MNAACGVPWLQCGTARAKPYERKQDVVGQLQRSYGSLAHGNSRHRFHLTRPCGGTSTATSVRPSAGGTWNGHSCNRQPCTWSTYVRREMDWRYDIESFGMTTCLSNWCRSLLGSCIASSRSEERSERVRLSMRQTGHPLRLIENDLAPFGAAPAAGGD